MKSRAKEGDQTLLIVLARRDNHALENEPPLR
jgi:hypothetical protein